MLKPGEFKLTITVPPSGNLQHPVPTQDEVSAAILAGFAANGLPTPTIIFHN